MNVPTLNARTILAVDLDYFFAQAEEIRNPEIKKKPVVVCVYSGRTENSGAVSTANYVARSLGVNSGIPIVSAKRILSKHQEAVFLKLDKEYYEEVSERVMNILRSIATNIEQMSVDEAYLDVTEKTRGDYEYARNIAKEIKTEIMDAEHLTCSVGVGPNKLVAKMAADSKKPDGLTVILPDKVRSFLDPLPVGKLFGIGPKSEKKLGDLGIRTIGDLAEYSEERLSLEFGRKLGPQLRMSAQGTDDEPVTERETEQLSRIITLKHNATRFDFSQEMIPLYEDISARLSDQGLLCKSIGVMVITAHLKTKNRTRTFDTPTNSLQVLKELCSDLFQELFREEPGLEIRRAGVRVSSLQKMSGAKKDASITEFFGIMR